MKILIHIKYVENAITWEKQSSGSVLENFTKFTGKHLCQSLFCNKVGDLRPAKETLAHVFSSEFCEIFKNTFFHRTPLVAVSELFEIAKRLAKTSQ